MFESNDKEMLQVMVDSLSKYLKAAGRISKQRFDELSEYNGLLWLEITKQKEILENILARLDSEVGSDGENVTGEGNNKDSNGSNGSVNGPLKLYEQMVDYLKKQNFTELHWVRVYSVKFPQQDFNDFEIKYFEHKDLLQEDKNYLLFGNASKNYVLRRMGNEIVGDTNRCFEYILSFWNQLK
ncbi:MAG TPA: hypothetical protein PK033_02910 [Acetivibrio sp.]|nr:hypothetical protein [Acetivibrio sp.]HPT90549.1 hypothetical protein [Acetivibrio sp.]HQA56810.1 hypothetical protein [Acetivibrio sp.]